MVIACTAIIYTDGWKHGIKRISFILLVVSLYVLAIKFFGQKGKYVLAFFLVAYAIIVLYRIKKKGGNIWWG